ncbi:MAG TPA: EAL domain-containing protein [Gammaproteobacteria bacterium]|nr:EAL domain-containing protein [Gammaproteobacteria bacterium]
MISIKKTKRFLGSFAGRIILGGTIIHALMIPFLFASVLFIVEAGFEDQFISASRSHADHLTSHLLETPASAEHLQAHLDGLLSDEHIVFAEIRTASGLSLAAAVRPNYENAVFIADHGFAEHGDSIYFLARPAVLHNGEPVTLRLGYDERPARLNIRHIYYNGLVLAAAYVLFSLLLVAVITPQLTRPLKRLRDAAQDITAGKTVARLHAPSRITEVAELARDLERMHQKTLSQAHAVATREARLQAIMDNVVDGIITVDPHGNIQSMNRSALDIFGYHSDEIIGSHLNTLLARDHFCALGEHQDGHRPITGMGTEETVGRHKDGHEFPIELALSEMRQNARLLFIAIVRDITRRKEAEAELKALQEDLERRVLKRTRELATLNRELEHQALHDALTELPNRLLLQDRLRQAILAAGREHHPLALLLMDLDHFKEINDTLGHHVGDMVLQDVARRMRTALRGSDTIARLGGDEFAILLPVVDSAAHAEEAARKLLNALNRAIMLDEQGFHVGASIGIALCPEHGRDGATLLRHADVAMYVAKRSASGYAVYDPREDEHSPSRLALVGELREAIERRQLVVFYQPKIELGSGRVTGVEAVVRWNHPQRGLLLPDDFIPLAEHTGLIRPLTFFVLEEALHQLHLWRRDNLGLALAVNLSARLLQDQQLAQKIARLMRHWEVPASCLAFEITESAIMADPLRAMNTLQFLNSLGVSLAIDDFGTGYSSLIYLKQLPVDEIKIDKSFVINMLRNNEDLVIVRATIDLAHNMGRRVVAEGVESAEVLKELARLGCDLAQGYHVSRPLTAGVLGRWLGESSWRVAAGDAPCQPTTS